MQSSKCYRGNFQKKIANEIPNEIYTINVKKTKEFVIGIIRYDQLTTVTVRELCATLKHYLLWRNWGCREICRLKRVAVCSLKQLLKVKKRILMELLFVGLSLTCKSYPTAGFGLSSYRISYWWSPFSTRSLQGGGAVQLSQVLPKVLWSSDPTRAFYLIIHIWNPVTILHDVSLHLLLVKLAIYYVLHN